MAPTLQMMGEGVLLVSARVGMLFIAAPVFGAIPLPRMAKVLAVLAFGAALYFSVPVQFSLVTPLDYALALFNEVLIGGVIATGLFIGFSAFHFAGRLLDMQIGLGFASMFDFATKSHAPLLGMLLTMLATVVFFAADGHLAIFQMLHQSLLHFPPGSGFGQMQIGALLAQFATCFSFGFVMVAPVVLALLLVDIAMSMMSRTMPQMNVFIVSLAVKVWLGLMAFAISVQFSAGLMRRVFESIYRTWEMVLGHG